MNFKVVNPQNTKELLNTIQQQQGNHFRFGAGFTDLILDLKKQPTENLTVINLAQLQDETFTHIHSSSSEIKIGAMVTVSQLISDKNIKKSYTVLYEAALQLASMQIRQVATIGGNLCTASPSGDISCALMALEASCEILNTKEEIRTVPLASFFTGVRKTVLQKDEILRSIVMPTNSKDSNISNFIKIGTRRSMECSVVSLAYHIQIDDSDKIEKAGIAIGASAPTVRFASSACTFLKGKKVNSITEQEKLLFADKVLEYASPISDIRGSAWYRKKVLHNISKGIFEN